MTRKNGFLVTCGMRIARAAAVLGWLTGLLLWGPATAEAQRGRVLPLSRQQQPSVFLPAPRELHQELNKAIADLEDESYVDAIARLDLILRSSETQSGEFGEDYFLPGKESAPLRSLKSEALRLIGELPAAGREVYELQHGAEARRMLEDAVKRRDAIQLENVSRRFFHTPAGYDATMLLGRERLERGRPLAAVLHFQRLLKTTWAAKRYGAELPLLLATALRLSGRDEQAREVLVELHQSSPDAEVLVCGEPKRLFSKSEDALDWLAHQTGELQRANRNAVKAWNLFGGDARRAAISDVDMPLKRMRWQVPVANDPQDGTALERISQAFTGQAVTPTMHPLVVNDTILMRTVDGMLAVDLATGLRIWPYPWFDEDAGFSPTIGRDPFSTGGSRRAQLLRQRVWEDSLFGQMSSDGKAVFLLDKLRGDYRDVGFALTNEMAALELKSEGKTLWIVGGADGKDEPKLAGAFFLGPPLPVGDTLYAIAEFNGEIRLTALDKDNGRLQWSQQLAHVDARGYGSTRTPATQRRAAGVNACYADGVLVCPTSASGVVAVDIANRAFLWGFRYRSKSFGRTRYSRPTFDRWRDNSAMITQGKVILTPIDSDEIYCLDLLTGKKIWERTRKQVNGLFVAGVSQDLVVIVGKSNVSTMEIDSGESGWSLTLPGSPAGRGVQSHAHYFLATTTPELLKIDLAKGEIVQRVPTGEPLGNLVAYKDELIAQNSKWLRSYYQFDKLRKRVNTRLAMVPNDPWALEHDGLLLLETGQRAEGLQRLRDSMAAYSEDQAELADAAKVVLVDTMLAMLRDNEPGTAELAQEVESLIDRPDQRSEFLRLVTMNLLRAGKYVEAFRTNMSLLDETQPASGALTIDGGDHDLLEIDRHRRVRKDRWHRATFRDLWQSAPTEVQSQLAALIRQAMESADALHLNRLVNAFQDLPPAQTALLNLLSESISIDSSLPVTEGRLLRLAKSADVTVAAKATALLARVYTVAGRYVTAAEVYRQLRRDFGDIPNWDNQTGSQLADTALAENEGVRRFSHYRPSWPFGKVEITRNAVTTPTNPTRIQNLFDLQADIVKVSMEQPPGLTSSGLQLVYKRSQNGALQLRDAVGDVLWTSMPMPNARGRNPVIRTYGHLFVTTRSDTLLAINALSAGSALHDKVLWQEAGQAGVALGTPAIRSARPRKFAFGLTRNVTSGPNGQSIVSLGPVSDHGVVLRRWGDLVCLDPGTGETLWTRNHDIATNSEVWGDEDYVFVHKPKDKLARVFSTLDGRELERRSVPDLLRRIRCFGRYVLNYREDPDGIRLQLNDILASPVVWTHTFGEKAQATFVGDYELAVFEPGRGLQIFSVLTGKLIVDHPLETEIEKVDQIQVQKCNGQYIVTLGKKSTSARRSDVLYRSPDPLVQLLEAEVYAFDAETGAAQWSVPAKIDNYILAEFFAPELPVLVFLRWEEQGGKRLLNTLVLDARDGREIFQHTGEALRRKVLHLRGDRETYQIDLRVAVKDGAWTLRLTDTPRPPSPPHGHETATKRKNMGALDLLNSVINSVRKAMPLQQIPVQSDPFK